MKPRLVRAARNTDAKKHGSVWRVRIASAIEVQTEAEAVDVMASFDEWIKSFPRPLPPDYYDGLITRKAP